MKLSSDYLESVEFDLFEHAEGLPFLKDFALGSLIYHGSQSQIYRLCDASGESPYLLKAIPKRSQARLMLTDLMSLRHPRLQRIVEVHETERYFYIIKDYIPGRTLGDIVLANGPFQPEVVKDYVHQLIEGVAYLHAPSRNIVYRDIKPENVIINDAGALFLIDLESMRRVKMEQHADTVAIITKGYAAPEQYGYSQTDKRSDIYSIGATLYFMLTGNHLLDVWFSVSGASGFDFKRTSLSPKWSYIISKCVKFNPAERYQTVEELANDIKRHEGHSKFKSEKRWIRPKRILIAIVVSTVLFLGWQNMIGPEPPEGEMGQVGSTEENSADMYSTVEGMTEPSMEASVSESESEISTEIATEKSSETSTEAVSERTEPATQEAVTKPVVTTTAPTNAVTVPSTTAGTTERISEATTEQAVASSSEAATEATTSDAPGLIDLVDPSDPDSMYFKLTLSNAGVTGTVTQMLQVFDYYGHTNQCGSNEAEYVNGSGAVTLRQPAKSVPFIEGRKYVFVTYIDDSPQNYTLDVGERYARIMDYVYGSGNTLSLTFDTWKTYAGGSYHK